MYLIFVSSLNENNNGIPKKIESIISQMKDANGYIFVTPEYNYSLPPVLVNLVPL